MYEIRAAHILLRRKLSERKANADKKSLQKLHFSALHTSILSAENSSGSRNPKREKEMENEMATSKSNNLVNPNAREAMNRFKMEAASEVGVNLKQGYNGDLTSRQAGSIGGQMVKKMIAAYENGMQ